MMEKTELSNPFLAGRSGRPTDKILGTVVTVGLTFALLRLLTQIFRSEGLDKAGQAIQRMLLRRILQNLRRLTIKSRQTKSSTHRGFCHCRAVHFELLGPEVMEAQEAKGKIRFARVSIHVRNFQLVRGFQSLSKYYVVSYPDDPVVAARVFCSRCGVHILHAPDPKSEYIDVNVHCLEPNNMPKDGSVPLPGQWEEEESQEERYANQFQTDDFDHIFRTLKGSSLHSNVSPTSPATSSTANSSDRYCPPDQESRASDESEQASLTPVPLRISTEPKDLVGSPDTKSPQVRDQLKYYMGKHISP